MAQEDYRNDKLVIGYKAETAFPARRLLFISEIQYVKYIAENCSA